MITSSRYDLVIIGGGIAGSTLAKVMAERGSRVLVLEKEREFKDRVRGDAMAPWGVGIARELGIEALLLETCGHQVPWVDSYLGRTRIEHRHLPTTTKSRSAELAFYHPTMQEVMLQAAADAGAQVLRNANAQEVQRGDSAAVAFELDGSAQLVQSRMVVVADGRMSRMRELTGFEIQSDPVERFLSGVLLEGMQVRQDTCYSLFDTRQGKLIALFPQGNNRVRVYFGYPNSSHRRLQGASDVDELIEQLIRSGAADAWFEGARSVGPLVTFPSDDVWVQHPYHDRVVLIGDSAATNDPMYGQGLSLTLCDVRVLSQQLCSTDDWDAAGHAYAQQHDACFHVLHTFSHWFESIFYQTGESGNRLRSRVLPLLAKDPSRMPDFFMSGPEEPLTEELRQRLFGEDLLASAGPGLGSGRGLDYNP